MLATEPITQPEPTTDTMSDAAITCELEEIEQLALAHDMPFNAPFLWHTILDPRHRNLAGDEMIVLASIASLTKRPSMGCRATYRQVATRATAIKRLFTLASTVGWERIKNVIGVTQGTTH